MLDFGEDFKIKKTSNNRSSMIFLSIIILNRHHEKVDKAIFRLKSANWKANSLYEMCAKVLSNPILKIRLKTCFRWKSFNEGVGKYLHTFCKLTKQE